MVKIIETNIVQDYYDFTIIDHQSRLVEYPSWEDYVDSIKNYEDNNKRLPKKNKLYCFFNEKLNGYSIPRNCIIKYIKSDGHHLNCHYITSFGNRKTLLAYLVTGKEDDDDDEESISYY